MSHFINDELLGLREAIGEQVCQDAIIKEYQYILKNDV
jgi:hypothetical protein